MRHQSLIIAFIIGTAMAFAQNDSVPEKHQHHEFGIGVNLRTRGELRYGGISVEGEDEAKFITERTRLLLSYKQRHLEIKITPQHSGAWGTSGGGAFSMYEAWAEINSDKGLFARVGRQTLAYDDERVIGLDDWSMTNANHDALKLGYDGPRHHLHTVLCYNQNNSNMLGGTRYEDGYQSYKTMQLLWYHWDMTKRLGASLLFVNTGMQGKRDWNTYTDTTHYQQMVGTYVKWQPWNITLQGSFYYQFGRTEYDIPISAWMASIEATWNINRQWQPYAGYYHLSGDKNYTVPPPGGIGLQQIVHADAFNLLYASHHEFYGAMDFFYIRTYFGGYSPGLQDYHIGSTYKINDKFEVSAALHQFLTSIKVQDSPGKWLGLEVELDAKWRIMKNVSLEAGYSFMNGSKTMDMLKRSNDEHNLQWAWLMLVVNPKIFGKKW